MQNKKSTPETYKDLLKKLQPLFCELQHNVDGFQNGVPTFYNVMERTVRERLESLPPDVE